MISKIIASCIETRNTQPSTNTQYSAPACFPNKVKIYTLVCQGDVVIRYYDDESESPDTKIWKKLIKSIQKRPIDIEVP